MIVDPSTWQAARRVPLFAGTPGNLSRDPQGRIWIGYGADPGGDRRVQVLAPDGTLLKTFDACEDPYNMIHFAAGRAFIPCMQSGFYAAVVVVDLQSLTILRQVDIRIEGDHFLLLASEGDEKYFAMIGTGDKSNRVAFVDTHTLTAQTPIPLPYGYINKVIAYHDLFLLLNGNPDRSTKDRQDLVIVDVAKSPIVHTVQLAALSALWGAIEGDTLYIYHNAEYLTLKPDPVRAISRLNLLTNKSELWLLPNRWEARDLAIINGNIVLAHSVTQEPAAQGGLYRFDPVTGKLSLLVNIPGAEHILPPAP